MVRGLGKSIRMRDAERPVRDRMAARVPVVGPGKDKSAGEAAENPLAEMSGQKPGLFQLAMPERVHAQLAQQQRPVADQVVESKQVTPERLAIVQVDVE